MNQEVTHKQTLWDKVAEGLTRNKRTEVDNERIERILHGGSLFGFTIIDLFIFLSAILALIFLQLQPYLIPYLEGTMGRTSSTTPTYEEKVRRISSPSSRLKTSSPSAEIIIETEETTKSSKLNENIKIGEKVVCSTNRPELCTLECIVNPPFICGSDGKSYCSECQACAARIEWYVYQNEKCPELLPNESL